MNRDSDRSAPDRRAMLLSTLWIFAVLNYLYCDVIGHMDRSVLEDLLRGEVDGMALTPTFLFGAGVLMQIPIAMVLASRVLPHAANRWANVAAGSIMTVVQLASLTVGTVAPYYLFFSVIEVATTAFIVWFAWTWRARVVAPAPAGEPSLA